MDNGTIKPTAWGKLNAVEILELPSGQKVKIKKLGLLDLFLSGYLPVGLLQKTIKAFETIKTPTNGGTAGGIDGVDISGLSDADIQAFLTVVDKCVLKMVIEPKVTDNFVITSLGETANEDEVKISDIPVNDKIFIFNYCTQSSIKAEQKFFRRPASNNDATQHGDSIQLQAESIIEHPESEICSGI